MKKKKKKITRRKKKFFIILACYVATFVITAVVTLSTLAWFNGSTHAENVLYMGGPVYIHFADNELNPKRGEGALEINMPETWTQLYPGMNIEFEARAILFYILMQIKNLLQLKRDFMESIGQGIA